MNARPSPQGFTLVEVTLALMVLSIGVMAVFSLFPFGVKQAQVMDQDSRISLFAQEVFEGLQAKANQLNWAQVQEANGPWFAEVAAPHLWNRFGPQNNATNMKIIPDGNPHNIVYWYIQKDPTLGDIDDSSLIYRINIDTVPLMGDTQRYGKRVKLEVWSSSLKSSSANADYVFYGSIINFRGI